LEVERLWKLSGLGAGLGAVKVGSGAGWKLSGLGKGFGTGVRSQAGKRVWLGEAVVPCCALVKIVSF